MKQNEGLLASLEESASYIIEAMRAMEEVGQSQWHFTGLVHNVYLMCEAISARPEWLEAWLYELMDHEAECRVQNMEEYFRRLLKEADARRNWIKAVEMLNM